MKLATHILITVLAAVFVIIGPLIDCLGGLDGSGSAGPTLWRIAKIAAGAAIIALVWSPWV